MNNAINNQSYWLSFSALAGWFGESPRVKPVGWKPWNSRHFDAAMAAKDSAGVSRFAKLFHPLGAMRRWDIHVDRTISGLLVIYIYIIYTYVTYVYK